MFVCVFNNRRRHPLFTDSIKPPRKPIKPVVHAVLLLRHRLLQVAPGTGRPNFHSLPPRPTPRRGLPMGSQIRTLHPPTPSGQAPRRLCLRTPRPTRRAQRQPRAGREAPPREAERALRRAAVHGAVRDKDGQGVDPRRHHRVPQAAQEEDSPARGGEREERQAAGEERAQDGRGQEAESRGNGGGVDNRE